MNAQFNAILALIAVLIIGLGFKTFEVNRLQKQVAELSLSNDTLNDALNDQNQAIEKFKAIVTELEKKAEDIAKTVKTNELQSVCDVEAILKQIKPADCAGSIKHLREKAKDSLQWQKNR
jgi:uncharacterized protein HemX